MRNAKSTFVNLLSAEFRSGLKVLFLFCTCIIAFPAHAADNIARGCAISFSAPPNYAPSSDAGDATQLTDGIFAPPAPSFWDKKESVGWQNQWPLQITIDLKHTEPVSGVMFSTAARPPVIPWPCSVLVYGSSDNAHWQYGGEVISSAQAAPAAKGYQTFRFETHTLHVAARYVRLIIWNEPYVFCDEIQIYRGQQADVAVQTTPSLSDADLMLHSAILTRLNRDAAGIRHEIKTSPLDETVRHSLLAQLDTVCTAFSTIQAPQSSTFQAVLPLNDVHAQLLAVHAAWLRAQKLPPLCVWQTYRYQFLPLLAKPSVNPGALDLNISMLRNEHRATSVILTNTTDKPIEVKIKIGPQVQPPRLSVLATQWTDTREFYPVADALRPVVFKDGIYQLAISSGMSTRLWLSVNSTQMNTGVHKNELIIADGDQTRKIPFQIDVARSAMPRPRLSLGVYDYSAGDGLYGITPSNKAAALLSMRDHFVDTTWGTGWKILPIPSATCFDAENQLHLPADYFHNLDQWVKEWQSARHYFILLNIDHLPNGTTLFAETQVGSTAFNARAGLWAKAIVDHLREQNLIGKVGVQFVDEPKTEAQDRLIADWSHAFKAAAPEIVLFSNPVWPRPDQSKIQDAITLSDILCPQLPIFYDGGAEVQHYFKAQQAGRQLWFYQASGPVRLYDPTNYYRLQAWQAFGFGATGEQFWSFADVGGTKTSWNEYGSKARSYAPEFLSFGSVTDSVHWEAVREGVEDYEYLALLREAAGRTKNHALAVQAGQLLEQAVSAIIANYSPNYAWNPSLDIVNQFQIKDPETIAQSNNEPSLPDFYRFKIIPLLDHITAGGQ